MRERTKAQEVQASPLRLRRADAHPDAPSRQPLLAGIELGEPEPAPLDLETNVFPEWERPIEDEAVEDDSVTAFAEPPLELEEPTIAQLVQRLELGLNRRQQEARPFSTDRDETAIIDAPPPLDDRLRSALDDLRTMAARSA